MFCIGFYSSLFLLADKIYKESIPLPILISLAKPPRCKEENFFAT